VSRFNSRKPRYNDDSDYTTNAPSYYDDLARKNQLIKYLAKKIWDYEEILNKSLEEIENILNKYIDIIDGKIELIDHVIGEGFEHIIEMLLREWLQDGTLDHIINEEILKNKADHKDLDYVIRGNRKGIKPSFVFVDDDGKKEVATFLKDYLDGFNVPFTSAIITDRVGSDRYLTEHDIIQLRNYGVDIVSHTRTHPNLRELNDDQLINELKGSKEYLESIGIYTKHLMYPYGNTNDRVIRKVREFYDSACGTAIGINDHPIMSYHLRRIGVGVYGPEPFHIETYIPFIDETISKNGLCIFMLHIEETPESKIDLIRQIINYVRSKGYDFETYSEAYEKHKNSLEQGLYTTSNQEHYNVVGADGSRLSSTSSIYTSRFDEFNFESVPSDFRSRTKTITLIRDNNSSGFPLNRGGELVTDRLSTDDTFTQQFYIPRNSGKEYLRYWNVNTSKWSEFIDMTSYQLLPSNTKNFNNKPNDFPDFKISSVYISDNNANGFPDNKGGVLTTYKLTSDDSGVYQELKRNNRNSLYIRTWEVNSEKWNEFTLIGGIGS